MSKKNDWVTRDILLEVYTRTGSIHRTAKEFNVGSTTITRWFKKFDIHYTPRKELPLIGLRGVPKTESHKRKLKIAANKPEAKKRSRENLLKRFPTMNGYAFNSPLEKILDSSLRKAKISFIHQKVMLGKYVVDFLLKDYPIIIEADGALHYLDQHKKKDIERDKNLLNAGYITFRFHGKEINSNPRGCINQVIAYINKKINDGEWEKSSGFTAEYLKVEGRNHPSFGKRRSKESIEKQRKALIGRHLSKEHIENIRKSLKGKKHPTAGAKISKAKMGHTVSVETRRKISDKLKGQIISEQTKKKISDGLKKAYATGKKSRVVTDETRRKISETLKNRNSKHKLSS